MIPKIIHYSWFSGEEMPASFKEMMATWQEHLKDYTFVCWDREALEASGLLFAKEAAAARKWAFAADAIRVYAVYTQGGIWLDGDVAVYKSFDSFLHHRMFIGKEHAEEFLLEGCCQHANLLTSHCFGAEKGHPFLKECVDYYRERHFVRSENLTLPEALRMDMRPMPFIQTLIASENYGYRGPILEVGKEEVLREDIHVYPARFFDSPKYEGMDDVVCIHFHFHSWTPFNQGRLDLRMLEKPRKKNLTYYLFKWANRFLAKRGLQIKVMSI